MSHWLLKMFGDLRVFDQHDLSRADLSGFPVARGQFHARIEIDDILPPRRRMPGTVMFRLSLPEYDAIRELQRG